jgi:hypothetical protein
MSQITEINSSIRPVAQEEAHPPAEVPLLLAQQIIAESNTGPTPSLADHSVFPVSSSSSSSPTQVSEMGLDFLEKYLAAKKFDHLEETLKAYHTYAFCDVTFTEIIESTCQIKDPHLREQQLLWLAQTLSLLRINLSDEQLNWVKEQGYLEKLSHLPVPELRQSLSSYLIPAAGIIDVQTWDKADSGNREVDDRRHLILLLYLALFQEIPEKELNSFWKVIRSKYFVQNTPHFAVMMRALLLLTEEKGLNPEEKTNVISRLQKVREQGEKALLLALYSLVTILELKESNMLKANDNSFSNISMAAFKKHIPVGDIDQFDVNYANTFARSRFPHALITYAGKLKQRGDKEYLVSLADFTKAVLNGTYRQLRYRLDNSPHLSKINSLYPGLLEKWQTAVEKISVSPEQNLTAIISDDPYQLLNCGKDVSSCLSWDGDPGDCSGLIGYLLHGQTLLGAVVNAEGRIHSRAIMRLLLDEEDKPVLFLERFYPEKAPIAHVIALYQLAKRKAEQMGVPLTSTQWETKGGTYTSKLHSLGGPAPNEHVDAIEDDEEVEYGKFEISDVKYLEFSS